MATEVVKIVDTGGGGDYSSLAAWEAGEQQDLVTADEIAVADCRCTTGAADTTAMTIDGWTTDDTRYIKIWTDPDQGYRHDGKWNTSAYRLEVSGAHAINNLEDNVFIFGLQVYQNPNAHDQYGIYNNGGNGVKIAYCIIKGDKDQTLYRQKGIHSQNINGETVYIWNNIIYNFKRDYSYGIFMASSYPIFVCYNNTVINCYYGVYNEGVDQPTYCTNNLSSGSILSDFTGTYDSDSDYNASSDTTAPGANSRTNQTFTFVDVANDDYHLDSTDTGAKDYGTDLSSDPYLSFTDDIDGETRSAPWDIGADEYVSGGGGETITLAAMSLQYAGESLLTNETFNLDPFSLSFTGKTLFTSEAFNLVRKSLFFSGKNMFLNESISLDRGALSFTGKTLFFNEALRLAKQALTWAGKELEAIQGYVVTLAAGVLSWAGRTLHLNETYSLARGILTFTGKSLAAFTGEMVSMAKGVLTWAGNAISTNEVITLAKGTLKFIGKSLRGLGRTVRSELSTWLKIK